MLFCVHSQQLASPISIANLLLLGMVVRRGCRTRRLLGVAVVRTELTRRRGTRPSCLVSHGRRGGRTMWIVVLVRKLLLMVVMVLLLLLLIASAHNLVIVNADAWSRAV